MFKKMDIPYLLFEPAMVSFLGSKSNQLPKNMNCLVHLVLITKGMKNYLWIHLIWCQPVVCVCVVIVVLNPIKNDILISTTIHSPIPTTSHDISFSHYISILLLVGGLEHVSCFHILGMSSSQLTNSYFSEGVAQPPTRSNQYISLWIILCHSNTLFDNI